MSMCPRRVIGLCVTALLTIASPALTASPATAGSIACDESNAPTCNGDCIGFGVVCRPIDPTTCACVPGGCCLVVGDGLSCLQRTQQECGALPNSTFVPDGNCGGSGQCFPTQTPTVTPTLAPTNTRVPNGGSCTTPGECASGNCVNGTCQSVPAAPAASPLALLLGLGVLIVLGGTALVRRTRTPR
jgi:hypothetical protein